MNKAASLYKAVVLLWHTAALPGYPFRNRLSRVFKSLWPLYLAIARRTAYCTPPAPVNFGNLWDIKPTQSRRKPSNTIHNYTNGQRQYCRRDLDRSFRGIFHKAFACGKLTGSDPFAFAICDTYFERSTSLETVGSKRRQGQSCCEERKKKSVLHIRYTQ